MKIHMAEKWPETVLEQLFKSNIHFRSVFTYMTENNVHNLYQLETEEVG